MRRREGAAQEDRRADQQQRRGEHLDADQRVARAAGPGVADQLAAQRPQRRDPRRPQRRHQREEGGGGHCRDDQEQRPRASPRRARSARGSCPRGRSASPATRSRSGSPSATRETTKPPAAAASASSQALGHELTDDAAPRGAEGQANADLALPRHAASQQQVGDVGAADQQDQAEREEQRREDREGFQGLRQRCRAAAPARWSRRADPRSWRCRFASHAAICAARGIHRTRRA